MGTNESNIGDGWAEVDDQPVFVALDVEDDSPVCDEAGRRIVRLDFGSGGPLRFPELTVPGLKRGLGVLVLGPKFAELLASNHPHSGKIACSRYGNKSTLNLFRLLGRFLAREDVDPHFA